MELHLPVEVLITGHFFRLAGEHTLSRVLVHCPKLAKLRAEKRPTTVCKRSGWDALTIPP